MKLSAVNENCKIKITNDRLKRLGLSDAVCFVKSVSNGFVVVEVFGRGMFAIEKELADKIEVINV